MFYDADCPICTRWTRRTRVLLRRRGFEFVPLQTPGTASRLHLADAELLTQMRLLNPRGEVFGGADAIVEIARQVSWARPLAFAARLPGVQAILRRLYTSLAAHRFCRAGACQVRPRAKWDLWVPLLLLPVLAWMGRSVMPAWVFMWSMAMAFFAACKWLTFRRAQLAGQHFTPREVLSYLFGWVGLDPSPFASNALPPALPPQAAWIAAAATTTVGAALVWLGVRPLLTSAPLAAGWAGMVGVILMLHFGVFRLLALAWQRAGVPVQPLMNAPARAATLGEFWGKRWNTGFNVLVRVFLFRPWVARGGRPLTATLIVFLFSGLVHELVITVPARAGFGLPTAYFLLQAAALLLERSEGGRRAGLGHGSRGRCFALAVVALPIGWLFPPVFVHHIILPMLHAIGAY